MSEVDPVQQHVESLRAQHAKRQEQARREKQARQNVERLAALFRADLEVLCRRFVDWATLHGVLPNIRVEPRPEQPARTVRAGWFRTVRVPGQAARDGYVAWTLIEESFVAGPDPEKPLMDPGGYRVVTSQLTVSDDYVLGGKFGLKEFGRGGIPSHLNQELMKEFPLERVQRGIAEIAYRKGLDWA